jgi:type VI secretion system secreted protein Hcp
LTPQESQSLLLEPALVPVQQLQVHQMAADIFAKIGDIKGESADDKHKDEIEVLSYSWGVTKPTDITATGGGGGAGKATFHDLSFTHRIDTATPKLMEACATSVHLKDATITHRKAGKGQQEFLIIKMSDVIVTGAVQSDAGDGGGAETVNMVFAKVDFSYRPQKADGSLGDAVHFKFDIKGNKIV